MLLNNTTPRKYDLCTHKPFEKGPSKTQFCVISATANDLLCRPASDGKQEVGGAVASDSEGPHHSYSDMATSSPTMHMVDKIPMPPGRNPGLDRWVGQINVECASTVAPIQPKSPIMDTSDSNSDEGLWTMVRCRRTCNARINENMNDSIDHNWALATEVQSAVQQAEQALTSAQKEQISHRNNKVNKPYHERFELQGEGTSNLKGKHIDPQEWGNVHLSDSEADVHAQQAALESYNLAAIKKPKENHDHREASRPCGTSKSHGKHHKNDLPAESHPIAQVPAESSIGVALKNIGQCSCTWELPGDPSSNSSSSQSESSESSDPSSDSDSDSLSNESHTKSHWHVSKHPRSCGHSSKKKKYHKSKSQCSGHSKAIKPNEYDGTADAHTYHRFI